MAATRFGSVPPPIAFASLAAFAGFLRVVPIAASFVSLNLSRFFGGALRFFLALRAAMGRKNSTSTDVDLNPHYTVPRKARRLRKAWPRWLCWFFSAAEVSAKGVL